MVTKKSITCSKKHRIITAKKSTESMFALEGEVNDFGVYYFIEEDGWEHQKNLWRTAKRGP